MDEPKSYASRKEIIRIAQQREAIMKMHAQKLVNTIVMLKQQMNGMTQLLGCIALEHGQLDYSVEDIEAMNPGRMYIVEQDGKWSLRIRDDADKPVELSIVPEHVNEEDLNREKMDADGVKELRFDELN